MLYIKVLVVTFKKYCSLDDLPVLNFVNVSRTIVHNINVNAYNYLKM